MKRKLTRTQKTLLSFLLILIFIALFFYYAFRVYQIFAKDFFVKQSIMISEANQKPVFKVNTVLLFNSANAIDNTAEHSLKDLDISQFSDIAIYIDNKAYIQELTQENTVKNLRIDNIEILSDQQSRNQKFDL